MASMIKFVLAVLFVMSVIVFGLNSATHTERNTTGFTQTTKISNDHVPFDRYCGYLLSVGHGSITFEDREPIEIVHLTFRGRTADSTITRILYGDEGRLRKIRAGQFYDIGARRYNDNWSFPRRLDVVSGCN